MKRLTALILLVAVVPAWAQLESEAELATRLRLERSQELRKKLVGKKPEELYAEGIHLVKVHRFEDAAVYLDEYLKTEPDPVDIYNARQKEGYALYLKLFRIAPLRTVGEQLNGLANQGWLKLRSDVKRIQRWVELLESEDVNKFRAMQQLRQAGVYALPELFRVLRLVGLPPKKQAAMQVILRIRQPAVIPLVRTLEMTKLPTVRQACLSMIRELRPMYALPVLAKLDHEPGATDELRNQVNAIMQRLAGKTAEDLPTAAHIYALQAEGYLLGKPPIKLTLEQDQVVTWDWHDVSGLKLTPLPTAIAHEMLGIRAARQALESNPRYSGAQAVLLSLLYQMEGKLGSESPGDVEQVSSGIGAVMFIDLANKIGGSDFMPLGPVSHHVVADVIGVVPGHVHLDSVARADQRGFGFGMLGGERLQIGHQRRLRHR